MVQGNEEDATPAPRKRSRAKKVKQEDKLVGQSDDEVVKPAPAKKARGKKAIKQEEEGVDGETGKVAKPKPAAKRHRKAAVKEEPSEDAAMTAPESSNANAAEAPVVKKEVPEPTTERSTAVEPASEPTSEPAVKSTAPEVDSQATEAADKEETALPTKKGGRGKKG